MKTKIVKLIQHAGTFKVTLPREMIKTKGWESEEFVMVTMHEQDVLIIERANPLIPSQVTFHGDKELNAERTWKKEISGKK
ncbi:MAG: hypothetical protein IMF10_04330 [Proteobacteria bacterium]|nr:hypothetical protein [Pseudomonadota bacterium]